MDDTIVHFSDKFNSMKSETLPYPQSTLGFFYNLLPIDGAIDALHELESIGHDVNIATAPSIMNPHCWTEKALWVEHHLGKSWLNKLIITVRKDLLIGDFLIDDNISGRGQDKFRGELIHYGSDRYKDWNAVLTKLKS